MAFIGGVCIGMGSGMLLGWLLAAHTKDMEAKRRDERISWMNRSQHIDIGGER